MSRLGSMFGTPAPVDVEQDRRPAPGLGSMFGSRDKRAQYRTGTAQSGGGVRDFAVPPMAAAPDVGSPPAPYVDTTGNDRWVSGVNRATDQQLDRRMQPYMDAKSGPRAYRGVRNGSIAVSPGQSYLASDDALAEFNQAAAEPFSQQALGNAQIDRRSPVWQRQYAQTFGDAMQADRQRQIDYANQRVDSRLAASDRLGRTMGGGDYRAAGRTGVIPPRGMGGLPSDAGVMSRLTQPLGDGGPAAYAARADQDKRRSQAEAAMGGVGADGLTRYMPNQDLLAFANQQRAKEDERISELTGGAIQGRPEMKAMTPSEIQFYRHKMNMLTNPAYAGRINSQRSDRQEMLDNRREMDRARRAGALEAAGASQQMRNLMAGRGALGPGRDGFAALMSMAAMQNPNEAFGDFGQGFMALNSPNMLQQRLNAEQAMQGQRLGVEQTMQNQQIGAQERMLGQELSSRRTIADLNVAAQKAQAEAERNFMAAQNATSFGQRKELEDLAYKRQRESDAYNSRLQIMMNVENPYRAKMMLGMIGDGSGQMNPDYFDPTKNPMAFTPDYQADPSLSRYDNMMKAAAQARQYGLDDQQTREYLASNGLLPDQSDINRSTYDSAVDEMPSMTGNPFLDWMARSATKSARPYVSPYIESRQQKNNLRNLVNPGQPVGGMPINPNPVGDPTRLRRMMSSGF